MGPFGEENLTRSPTPAEDALGGSYGRALRVIGEQQLQIDSQRRALEALDGIMMDDAQRIQLLTEARDEAHEVALHIAREFAAYMALMHNAMPSTSGRVAQADLDELRATLAEGSEVAMDYLPVENDPA